MKYDYYLVKIQRPVSGDLRYTTAYIKDALDSWLGSVYKPLFIKALPRSNESKWKLPFEKES